MRAFLIVDLGEVIEDEDNKFPFAINLFRRSDSAVGKFFIILFLGWLMIPELLLLGVAYVIGFLLAFVLCLVPILNICILVDAINNDYTMDKILAITGLVIDVLFIIGILGFNLGWFPAIA